MKIFFQKLVYLLLFTPLLFLQNLTAQNLTPAEQDELREWIMEQSEKSGHSVVQDTDYRHIDYRPYFYLKDTLAAIELGRIAFSDERIGRDGKTSCATCHDLQRFGYSGIRFGIGLGGMGFGIDRVKGEGFNDIQDVKTPPVGNVAYNNGTMLWNGALGTVGANGALPDSITKVQELNLIKADGVLVQAAKGQVAHLLDASHCEDDPKYQQLFADAFGENTPIDGLHLAQAIAVFEKTITAQNAPFQRWLQGYNNALSQKELRGLQVFFKDGQCFDCHNGAALGNLTFAPITNPNPEDFKGRGGFTKNPMENYLVKVPQLYNVTDGRFYGFNSHYRYLGAFLNRHTKSYGIELTNKQKSDLKKFLKKSLYDDTVTERIKMVGDLN